MSFTIDQLLPFPVYLLT